MPAHINISPSILYFGTPVVLLATLNPNGEPNITPISSAWALGQTVVAGLGALGQGTTNLLRHGDCTINLPNSALWKNVEAIAKTTASLPVPSAKARLGYTFGADKFALGRFKSAPSERVQPPRISECPLQLEARLKAVHQSSSMPGPASGHCIVELEVVRVHAHENIVLPGSDHIDTEQWDPLYYVFRHYFGEAQNLGKNFRAET